MRIKPVFREDQVLYIPHHVGVPYDRMEQSYGFPCSESVHPQIVKDWIYTISQVSGTDQNYLFHPRFTSCLERNTPGYYVVTDMLYNQHIPPKRVARHPIYGFWTNHSNKFDNPWMNIFTYAMSIVDTQDSHDARVARYILGTTFDSLKLVQDKTTIVMEYNLSIPQLYTRIKEPDYIYRILPKRNPLVRVAINGRRIYALVGGVNAKLG